MVNIFQKQFRMSSVFCQLPCRQPSSSLTDAIDGVCRFKAAESGSHLTNNHKKNDQPQLSMFRAGCPHIHTQKTRRKQVLKKTNKWVWPLLQLPLSPLTKPHSSPMAASLQNEWQQPEACSILMQCHADIFSLLLLWSLPVLLQQCEAAHACVRGGKPVICCQTKCKSMAQSAHRLDFVLKQCKSIERAICFTSGGDTAVAEQKN